MFDNIIAKEGHKKTLVAFIAFLFFLIIECGLLSFISFVIFAFFIYSYRYKYIDIRTLKEDKIYAPISGKVAAIDSKDSKKSIYIDVSLCDSHILRSLDDGEAKVTINKGLNLSLGSYKAKNLNERAIIKYKNTSLELYSSICNDNIEVLEKETFKKGEKLGVFVNGQVIVNIPENHESLVSIGDKLQSGVTVLSRVKK